MQYVINLLLRYFLAELKVSRPSRNFLFEHFEEIGWDISVGIATRYGLDGRGIEPR
jgi:hypothetical protein